MIPMKRSIPALAGSLLLLAVHVAPGGTALAHTETDLVAVPAGSDATVTLKPTHGCGDSPTVAVRIRAPFLDARADEVEGWTTSATPDGSGNTVLEWTGGVLPADQVGAFPVEFTVPDAVGTLLTFPAVQTCEDGEELAWISGDPADEFPAPRVLVLAAGSEPAATIDDVALDAPGRDQLAAVVDVDNPQVTPTTPPAPPAPTTTVTTTAVPTSTPPGVDTVVPAPADGAATAAPTTPVATGAPTTEFAPTTTTDSDGGGSSGGLVVVGVLIVLAAVATAVVLARRRRAGA